MLYLTVRFFERVMTIQRTRSSGPVNSDKWLDQASLGSGNKLYLVGPYEVYTRPASLGDARIELGRCDREPFLRF